ncbi:MAG: hypothetical protein WC788_00965 [Candidatus Paceibacterota bacterium]|jgi:hypothetical protein
MHHKTKKIIASAMIFVLIFAMNIISSPIQTAKGAVISSAQIQLSRIGPSENHSQILTFTINDAFSSADQTMIITYQSDFDINGSGNDLDFSDIDFIDDVADVALAASPAASTLGVGVTASAITFTQPAATPVSIASGSVITIKIGTNVAAAADKQPITPTAGGTYSIVTSGTFGGTGTLYVPITTTVDDDQVTVSAEVPGTLTFAIRNSAETADTNACALGTLSTSSVSSCSYRLKIGASTSAGFQVGLWADDQLNQASASIDIDDIAENGTVSAGTEGHGITVASPTNAGAAGTATTWTEQSPFDDDDTPIPVGEPNMDVIFSSNGTQDVDMLGTGDTDGTTLITHETAISTATQAGSYDQIITYVVSSIL